MAAACADSSFPVEIVRRIAAANAAWATKTGLTHADVIAAWLAASPSDRARLLPDLLSVACTKDGKLRAVQKGQTGAEPDYASLCERLHDSCSARSEEHTSELQSLMRISYDVFCLKKKQQ